MPTSSFITLCKEKRRSPLMQYSAELSMAQTPTRPSKPLVMRVNDCSVVSAAAPITENDGDQEGASHKKEMPHLFEEVRH